jgi:hypothetical protein
MEHDVKVIMVKPVKSMVAAILLPIFLGPIGLLYASFWGSVIILVLMLISSSLPLTYSALVTGILWLASIYWCAFKTARELKRTHHHCCKKD